MSGGGETVRGAGEALHGDELVGVGEGGGGWGVAVGGRSEVAREQGVVLLREHGPERDVEHGLLVRGHGRLGVLHHHPIDGRQRQRLRVLEEGRHQHHPLRPVADVVRAGDVLVDGPVVTAEDGRVGPEDRHPDGGVRLQVGEGGGEGGEEVGVGHCAIEGGQQRAGVPPQGADPRAEGWLCRGAKRGEGEVGSSSCRAVGSKSWGVSSGW